DQKRAWWGKGGIPVGAPLLKKKKYTKRDPPPHHTTTPTPRYTHTHRHADALLRIPDRTRQRECTHTHTQTVSHSQAEDGIRDSSVTGVQTCALPISSRRRHTRFKCDWSSDVCSSD